MIAGLPEDMVVKRTAVKLLWGACSGLVESDAPLTTALGAALNSPNDELFLFNFRIAEREFLRLPRSMSDRLMSRCRARLVERSRDILAHAEGRRPADAAPAVSLMPSRPASAVEW